MLWPDTFGFAWGGEPRGSHSVCAPSSAVATWPHHGGVGAADLGTALGGRQLGPPRDIGRRQSKHYETAYRRSLESLRWTQVLMGDPKTVATVIVRALTARWPSARYLVGYDAQLVTLTDMVLPTAVKDRLSRLMLGL